MSIEIFVYRKNSLKVEEGFTVEGLSELLADQENVVWIDFEITGKEEEKFAEDVLINVFKFHPLSVEDARETRNQPKIEIYGDYLFFILHGVKNETNSANFVTKELDGYLGSNYVVTYHDQPFRSIDTVKHNIRVAPYLCKRGADYLLHQILDRLIDLYMPVVDDFDQAIINLEEEVFQSQNSSNEILEDIMDVRRSVARMKRISARQLDVLYRLSNGEFPQIKENILPFYRDIYDHLQRISDLSENYRDLVSSLFDIHFSVVATKTNDVMKFLTIFSTIMLPLTLIAGIYGMNFENMPELHTKNGYFYTLALMAFVTIALLFYFWRRGWIFERKQQNDDSEESKKG